MFRLQAAGIFWCFHRHRSPPSLHLMTPSVPASDDAEERMGPHVSEAAVRRLAEAIASLANDPNFFVEALTETLLTMKPISRTSLSASEVRFMIESGAFTAEEWAETSASVKRGELQLSATESWLSGLLATISLEETAHYLGWSEEAVLAAEADGRLYGFEISGRMRFPTWQFNVGSPEKLIPGLSEILDVLDTGWSWRSVAGLMCTPQSSLLAEGRKTPVAWLRDGGDVESVKQIIESSDWW